MSNHLSRAEQLGRSVQPRFDSDGRIIDDRLLIPARDAARLLSVSERTLWSLTAPRGPIAPVRIGSRVLYSTETLRSWIAAQTQPAAGV